MGQSVKAILQLVLLIAALGAFATWNDPVTPTVLGWRYGGPVLAVVIIVLLWRNSRRRETLTDVLAQTCGGSYFERDGLCFGFTLSVDAGGVCWVNLYFQNRYARPCRARVVLKPPVKTLGIRRLPLTGIDSDIECDGAACGVWRMPWPIIAEMQGTTVAFEVACHTSYPNGRGRLMRFREGLRAGSVGATRGVAANLGLMLASIGSISSPATVQLKLPSGVAEESPPGVGASYELLYRPDLPTGGFPVMAVAAGDAEKR